MNKMTKLSLLVACLMPFAASAHIDEATINAGTKEAVAMLVNAGLEN